MAALFIAAMCLLALFAAAAILFPLASGPRGVADRRDHDLAVYRDQLAEIERDLSAGRIAPAQAAAARAEIERRILRGEERGADPKHASRSKDRPLPRALIWTMAIAGPVAATGLYLVIGAPGVPGMPQASRVAVEAEQDDRTREFTRLTERLSARLQAGEGDLEGWIMLARSYRALGRNDESAAAFRKSVEMAGGRQATPAEILEEFGESLFVASGGQVVPEARAAFEAALLQQPDRLKSRHYLAVAHAQAGESIQAIALWRGIEIDSPEDAPWLPELKRRIEELAGQAGVSAASIPPQRPAARTTMDDGMGSVPGTGTPTPAEMDAAARMSPEERAAFIRGMVSRLAGRLEASPEDAEGWVRLYRAYTVLGEDEKAADARRTAAAQFRARLDTLPPDSPLRPPIEARIEELDRPR